MEEQNNNLDYVERDLGAIIERTENFFNNSMAKLDLYDRKLYYNPTKGMVLTLKYDDFLKECDNRTKQGSCLFEEVAGNCLKVLNEIPIIINVIKNEVDTEFKELIKVFDEQQITVETLEEENDILKKQIMIKDTEIEELKEKVQQEKIGAINNRLATIEMALMSGNKMPESYFNTDVNDNIRKENNIGDEAIVVKEVKKTKNDRIQEAHDEVLVHMKEEELYPIHKVNTMVAKNMYKTIWEKICFKEEYDLSENDIPFFINALEDYYDFDDNYLDIVGNVKNEE